MFPSWWRPSRLILWDPYQSFIWPGKFFTIIYYFFVAFNSPHCKLVPSYSPLLTEIFLRYVSSLRAILSHIFCFKYFNLLYSMFQTLFWLHRVQILSFFDLDLASQKGSRTMQYDTWRGFTYRSRRWNTSLNVFEHQNPSWSLQENRYLIILPLTEWSWSSIRHNPLHALLICRHV